MPSGDVVEPSGRWKVSNSAHSAACSQEIVAIQPTTDLTSGGLLVRDTTNSICVRLS